MIKVELTRSRSPERKYRLRIDDKLFTTKGRSLRLTIDSSNSQAIEVEVDDPTITRRITHHTFTEIPREISTIAFLHEYSLHLNGSLVAIDYLFCKRTSDQNFELSWMIRPDIKKWSAPYSLVEFVGEFYRRLRRLYQVRFLDDEERGFEGDELVLQMKVQTTNLESTIEAEIFAHGNNIQRIYDQANAFLTSTLDKQSLAVFFDFPESISVACEQYLWYFGRFLQDLGVRAETALTHEAGQVLFTVTPTDQKEALDKIKDALNLYLELPSSPISDTANESIAVQRLESTVLRLRSDLKLAAAELKAKDATIKAQNLTIGILNGDVLVKSIREISPNPEDKEQVIPGIVALSTYKEKGLEINLGEMFRRIKKFFTED